MEKEETTIQPRWCQNDDKPKDHVLMIGCKWKKVISLHRTQKAVPMTKKRVENLNERRYNLEGVPMIGNKRDEV